MVVQHRHFKKSLLASVVSSLTLAGAVHAQDNALEEEVIVTGIRGSLQRSMDVKRDAKGVVDAISAEDIGKFPDSNLAESLQRITGVSIDRRNGEGFQITVRGFGPEFNQVTLNGRTMPTAQLLETGGLRSDRGFDMSNIASEGVSSVLVYKSGQADITSGGIGATVDLRTRRPFDTEGFKASVGAKLLNDTTNRVGDDVTPELSGFVSWSDDIWGIAYTGSYQQRDSARSGVFTNGWESQTETAYSGPDFIPNGVTDDAVIVNAPASGTFTNFTPGVRYNHMDVERKRQNHQVAFQVRPSESVEVTLDYTSATQEIEMNRAELSFWFGGGAFPTSAIEFQEEGGVATPLYWLTENPAWDPTDPADMSSRDVGFAVQGGSIENKLDSLGLNVAWDVTDELSVSLDAHTSEASALPGSGAPGNWWSVGLGGQGTTVQGIDNSGDFPVLVGIWDERNGSDNFGNVANEIDKGDIGSTVRQINYDRVEQDLDQIKIDGQWKFSNDSAINFGIERREMEVTNRGSFDQQLLEGGWGVATPGDVNPNDLELLNFDSLLDGYRTGISAGGQEFFAANYNGPEPERLQAFGNIAYIGDASKIGRDLSAAAGLDWAPNPNDATARFISEEVNSIYFQFDVGGEIENMPFKILAGVRYEGTKAKSVSQVAQIDLLWQGDNDFLVQAQDASSVEPSSFSHSYNHVLPNFSFVLDVTEDVVARVSWSETIARQSFNRLQQGLSGVGAPVGGPTVIADQNGGGTNGSISLLPTQSRNFDISFEWYFDEASYASIGYFDKRVSNFVGSEEVETAAIETQTRDPSAGPRARQALAALEADGLAGGPTEQQDLFRYVAAMYAEGCVDGGAGLCGNGDPDAVAYEGDGGWENTVDLVAIQSGALQDPYSVLDVNTDVNKNDAILTGFEVAVQHFFAETGFGVQANYTHVSSNLEYDNASELQQFALTGLSDTANIVGMFEKYDFQVRLAYNWREEFLVSAGANPTYAEDFTTLDLSINYEVFDNFIVGFEGFNLLEEDKREYRRSSAQLTSLEIYGARYALTARYSF